MKLPYVLIFILMFIFNSCKEIKTENPEKAYKFWIKSNPNQKLNVLKGNYWQSSHWSLEYIIYLKIDNNKKWWNNFKKDNDLIIEKNRSENFDEKPKWFNPPKESIIYRQNSDFDQGSRYFEDTLTGKIYIYEIQL